jgi:hypothetical protein
MSGPQDPNGYPSYGGQQGGQYPSSGSGQYGQPGAPNPSFAETTQPGTSYGQPAAYAQPPAAKKPRSGLKIALIIGAIVLVLIAVAGGVGFYFINQFAAPGVAALQFCNNLKSQSYDKAYTLLSSGLQATYSKDAFQAGVSALDTAEGKVTGCQQGTGANNYVYSLGSTTATVSAQLTRATQGTLVGALHMKNQGGSWKVDSIDTSLLGVNIGALQTAGAFCAAMQGGDYATAYSLLSSTVQGAISKDDFVASGKLHDQIDGAVSKCSLSKVPQGNTDQLSRLTIELTRAKLGAHTGDVTLKFDGTAWKVDATDAALNGTDLRPLVVGGTFCVLLGSGKYADAYGLFSSDYQKTVSQAQFVANFSAYQGMALKWTCEQPDYSTYSVTGTTASLIMPITVTIPSLGSAATSTDKFKVEFVLDGSTWKINDALVQG